MELPESIRKEIVDTDGNGIPDSMDTIDTNGDKIPDKSNLSDPQIEKYKKALDNTLQPSFDTDRMLHADYERESGVLDLGLSSSSIEEVTNMAQNLADGLSCGF